MAKKRTKDRRKRRFYKRKGLWIFLLICAIAGMVAWKEVDKRLEPYRQQAAAIDLSTIDDVVVPSLIYDRKGREIGRMYDENRSKIPIDKVPETLIDALLAQEDQRYWKHDGVDRIGVARAIYLNLKAGEVTQGASTITMQLARNAFDLKSVALDKGQRGFERKIVEAFLALRIEKELQEQIADEYPDEKERKYEMKRLVLEYYLNRIPFGSGFYGVRSASLGYFGKEPMGLTTEECASLVACVKNPTGLSPLRDPAKNKKARNHVLNRMLAEDMISESEWISLTSLPVKVNPKPLRKRKSHLYEIIDEITLEKVGIEAMARGGFRIYTTIDRELQELARKSLRTRLDEIERRAGYTHPVYGDFEPEHGKVPPYLQGAALMIDSKTGDVLVHVGGRDYAHSQYDFIVHGKRPFGTAFLPVIYTTALQKGFHPSSTVRDEQMDNRAVMVGGREGILGEWGMETIDPRYEGRIAARRALEASKIAASVRLGRDLGLEEVGKQAKAFGLDLAEGELLNKVLLGSDPVGLANAVRAYTAFSQEGRMVGALRYIERIENAAGDTIYKSPAASQEHFKKACDEVSAFQIHSMLTGVVRTGNLAGTAEALAVESFSGVAKTGTTHNFTDGWCLGYNGSVSLGMWVGFHSGVSEPIYPNAFGRELTFGPWTEVMKRAEANYPAQEIPVPESLEMVMVCGRSGLLATRYCYEPVTGGSGDVSFRFTGVGELLRVDRAKLGLCDVHGQGGIGTNEVLRKYGPKTIDSAQRQRLAVVPIRPQAPALLGEDPYEAEVLTLDEIGKEADIMIRSPSLLLDYNLEGEKDASLRLRRPGKIDIETH